MSKIALALLAAGAFLYAAWLVVFRKELPEPARSSGLRRRFLLATLLFAGFLSVVSCKEKPMITCYEVSLTPDPAGQDVSAQNVAATLKAVWLTLDPDQGEDFRKKLETAVSNGHIRKRVADVLSLAFSEISYHKERTRGKGPKVTCYKMTRLGGTLSTTRENALKQIELLGKARKAGTIDEDTAGKAHAALAAEIEMLALAQNVARSDWQAKDKLCLEYKNGKIEPTDSVVLAAKLIVEMENGAVPDLTPAKRLASMKKRVQKLLSTGPAGNDWIDPGIEPNVSAVLEKAGLISGRPMVTCYDRAAAPPAARSAELRKLQADLLDKTVNAGVIDAETARKAATATAGEQEIDYAIDKDIQSYQKKVRRVMRMLYKRGELPSSFVRELEQAADVEILSLDSARALRNDMRYYLSSLFWDPSGELILKALEKRKLIPAARNHRGVLTGFGGQNITEEKQKQLADFEALIDGDAPFDLTGDDQVTVEKWQQPSSDIEYRLSMRRVCRALVKTRLADGSRLKAIEEVIGIPIVGTVEGK